MATVVLTPTARDDLERLIRTLSLPAAVDRVAILTIHDARSASAATSTSR